MVSTLSSSLATLRVRSFRTFRDNTKLPLGPLTLLYGLNQTGKSSLLRLLPLIADSLRQDVPGLDLNSPALCGATFKEIGWMGNPPSYTPWLEIITKNEESFCLQFNDDNGLFVNRLQLGVRGRPKQFNVSLEEIISHSPKSLIANYAGTWRGKDWSGKLTFKSMMPQGLPNEAQENILDKVNLSLSPVRDLQWLYADRLSSADKNLPTRWCQPSGSDLPGILQNNQKVVDKASSWLHEKLGETIRVMVGADRVARFDLGRSAREYLPLRLAGEGIRSLLPILLCACWAESGENAPTALVIEEPESHLHPNLQVDLLDRLVETVSKGIPVFLETHSVYILRALQLAVIEKRIAPEDVALFWVEQDRDGASSVVPIEVKPDATLKDWRPGIFEQEQELAHRILDARWRGTL